MKGSMSRLLGRALTARTNDLAKMTVQNQTRALTTTRTDNWIFPGKDAQKSAGHSTLLAQNNNVYQIISETVAPRDWDDYVEYKGNLFKNQTSKKDQFGIEHVGSWNFIYGDQIFQAFHLVKYSEGWSSIDKARLAMRDDAAFSKEVKDGFKLIQRQGNEFVKSFSFWPEPDQREGQHIYDVRSYTLKPGSLYDWSNYWAKGIKYRSSVRPDIPYAGFFTQLGQLHTIYHIWCYKDLADRKGCRENTWSHPDWNDVVSNTVPLMREMKTRILEPLPFSPTQ